MKILLIGGTGVISNEITRLSLQRGHEVYLLNRSGCGEFEALGARHIKADMRDAGAAREALAGMEFDVAADFICFNTAQATLDYELFNGRVGQFMFISSASAYLKPADGRPITESTPLKNPYWQYSRDKIACEEYFTARFREAGFPVTIIRPSHTYGLDKLPFPLSGAKTNWTYLEMLKRGESVVVFGDGTSLWTVTHSADFAVGFCGLMGRRAAVGHSFHITSDERLRWDDIVAIIGGALNVKPNIVHMAADRIIRFLPEYEGPLKGDKSECAVFDNSKLKSLVPEYKAIINLETGIRQVIAYISAHPELQTVDENYIKKIKELAAQA